MVYLLFSFACVEYFDQRPENYLGELETWEKAENALKEALDEFGKPWQVFYKSFILALYSLRYCFKHMFIILIRANSKWTPRSRVFLSCFKFNHRFTRQQIPILFSLTWHFSFQTPIIFSMECDICQAEYIFAYILSKTLQLNEGDGAFCGPKIDISVSDALSRNFQCATLQVYTVQLDLNSHNSVLDNFSIDSLMNVVAFSLTSSFLIVLNWNTQLRMKPKLRDLL